NTTAAAAPPTGRPIFACSTASIRAIGPDIGETVLPDCASAKRAFGSTDRARRCGLDFLRTLASMAAEAGQDRGSVRTGGEYRRIRLPNSSTMPAAIPTN